MNKKFIVWQLKRWIVPLSIFLGVITLMFVLAVMSADIYQGEGYYTLLSGSSILLSPMMTAILISGIFPLVVFSYKFGMQRCDFYNQLPFKPKEFKRTIMLLGLICVLVVVIVGYALGISIFALYYAISPATKTVTTYMGDLLLQKIKYNWGAVFYSLLYLILICSATYFISSCIVYNNIGIFESIICIALFHIAASSVALAIQVRLVHYQVIESFESLAFGVFPMIVYGNLFDTMFGGEKVELAKEFYINCGVYITLAAGGFAWTWLEKDRSAEIDNTKGEPKLFPIIVLHAGFLFGLALVDALVLELGAPLLGLVLWALSMVAYFFLNVLYKHGFGLQMKQWIPMIPIMALTFALCFF